ERPPRRDDRRRGRDREDHEDRDGVVGFGSDVPAFLSRPPGPRRSED
ncbi:MAG: hypothetical protein JWP49_775, partial [Phenylobacterium sp.]|nr:hypothetical protein [Phenylobacterium sp.]